MKKQTACPVCRGRGTITVITGNRNDICGVKNETCISCGGTGMNMENVTNADHIRAMSDEELAKVLNAFTAYFEECNRSIEEVGCEGCELNELCELHEGKALDWLQQPVKEDS